MRLASTLRLAQPSFGDLKGFVDGDTGVLTAEFRGIPVDRYIDPIGQRQHQINPEQLDLAMRPPGPLEHDPAGDKSWKGLGERGEVAMDSTQDEIGGIDILERNLRF
jgi:hypothetical protein